MRTQIRMCRKDGGAVLTEYQHRAFLFSPYIQQRAGGSALSIRKENHDLTAESLYRGVKIALAHAVYAFA